MDLIEVVRESITEHELVEAGERVLVGVSGGVDSVVLVEVLRRIGGFKLVVGHFNHCLRGAESDGDEVFVRELARRLKAEFVSGRGDVREFAEEKGVSMEMAARELRHGFLVERAQRMGIGKIALGHHADDQMETFWMRLLRGDVGPGLAGMRWKRRARAGTEIFFVRPMLEVAKGVLIDFARREGIEHREDSSNESPEILRNRLRLELVARLKAFQPKLREVTLRTAEVLRAEKDFLEGAAREWLTRGRVEGEVFEGLHVAMQREVVRVQLVDLGVKPSFDLIEEVRMRADVTVAVSAGRGVRREKDGNVAGVANEGMEFSSEMVRAELGNEGRVQFGGVEFGWKVVEERGEAGDGVEFFDAGKVGSEITLRHWKRGDRFQPIGLKGEAKLQDLFTNLKVSAAEKRRRLAAADVSGKIFWVEGLRISEGHKVSDGTKRILLWSWRRNR
jgi:tRNA(Ile)-lysidine synthase